jgi:O-antigen/teichoic acid export membrane protein
LTNRVLSVPVLAFQPEVSRLEAENRERSIVDTTRVFFKFNTAFATLAAFALAALSPELVRLVANEQYAAAAPLLRILAISVPLTAMTAPLTAVMKALDQVSRALFCDLAWAVSYVALLLYLGGTFGLTGVGAAQVLASLLQLTLALRLGRVKPALADVASTALKCLICGVVAFAPVLAAGLFLQSQTASMVVKLLLMLPAVLLFRLIAVKGLGLFNDGDRHALVSLLERRGMGAVARRLV